MSDLYRTRNMRLSFKSGFYEGGLKAELMALTRGKFPGRAIRTLADADEPKTLAANRPLSALKKEDTVFYSGNVTRDDIPQHLIVGNDVPPEVAEFYTNMCPAGVNERVGERLIVKAPNCIDCKATDVLGPRWMPHEGGSGPRYRRMVNGVLSLVSFSPRLGESQTEIHQSTLSGHSSGAGNGSLVSLLKR